MKAFGCLTSAALVLSSAVTASAQQRPSSATTGLRLLTVSLTVNDRTAPTLSSRVLQWGAIRMTASVTGAPANTETRYRFEIWGWDADRGTFHGNQPVARSAVLTSPQWTWIPPSHLSASGAYHKFIVTVELRFPEGTVVRTGEAGPYRLVDDERARLLWSTIIGPVVTFHRCVNCHRAGDSPTQGDDRHTHVPAVTRQTDCRQCHGNQNGATAGSPPGAFGHWRMPPPSFAFAGKSAEQICRQIKDPAQNGGRSLEQLREHVKFDEIVRWAWSPGPGRTPAPHTWEIVALGAFVQWVRAGAACPEMNRKGHVPNER